MVRCDILAKLTVRRFKGGEFDAETEGRKLLGSVVGVGGDIGDEIGDLGSLGVWVLGDQIGDLRGT